MLNGILNFLTSKTFAGPQQDTLLDNFVFKIIPVLNPDGVYRGYYRLDTRAQNLNRYYLEPTPHGQPTILAAKAAILHALEHLDLEVYVDIHAHATKRGCFMFGNSLQGQPQLTNMLLPRCVSLNSLNFDFDECCFADKMMDIVDKKDGLSREGSGRVAMMKATGLANCYTLECNYASGNRINRLYPKVGPDGKIEAETHWVNEEKCQYYQEYKDADQSPPYNIAVFEDVGRAFLIGLLDFYCLNPVSRLPKSPFKDLEGLKKDILAKTAIFIPPKRRLEEPPPLPKHPKTKSRRALRLLQPKEEASSPKLPSVMVDVSASKLQDYTTSKRAAESQQAIPHR